MAWTKQGFEALFAWFRLRGNYVYSIDGETEEDIRYIWEINEGEDLPYPPYTVVHVEGSGIKAIFSYGRTSYGADYLFVDNIGCWDKMSKCPLIVKLDDEVDWDKIGEEIDWLASEEGFKWSNTYGYLEEPKLTRQWPPRREA